MFRGPDRLRPPHFDVRRPSFSEDMYMSEPYFGPTQFMEAGARGFLVSTLDQKEEFAVDDAIDLLRQTAIKVYGGYKPKGINSKNLENNGYVKVDCLNLEDVKIWPHPGGEEEVPEKKDESEAENQKNQAGATEAKEGEVTSEVKVTSEDVSEVPEQKIDKDKEITSVDKDKEEEEDKEGEESKQKSEKEEEEKKDTEKEEDVGTDKSETDKEKAEEQKDDEAKVKADKKKEEEQKENAKKKLEEEERKREAAIPRMHSIYKFKAYRTEMRNTMFIMSDVPNPMEVAHAAMELVLERKSVTGDAVLQLLPVLGVCQYDYQQLEVMSRRTLAPVFDENMEPQSFAVMLIDKLSEPGAEVVYEIARNSVWSINPLAWLSSPISEPDIVIRFELVGSKLVMSCLKNYMKLRQYSPALLVDLGEGAAEDDDGGWMSEEAKRQLEQKRLERESQREQERLKEMERQKERAKKLEEAEARRKAREEEKKKREEERKEKQHQDQKEKEEKEKQSPGKDDDKTETPTKKEDKSAEEGSDDLSVDEDTPPSKKQKTDSEDNTSSSKEEGKEEDISEVLAEETPPSKKQKVDSGLEEVTKEEEELLLADDSTEDQEKKDEDSSEDQPKKTPTRRTTRGKRAAKKGKTRQGSS